MNKRVENHLKSTYGALGFSLFGGAAYFMLALTFVMNTTKHGGLFLLFVFPAVICGAALVLLKLIKQNNENENTRANAIIFYLHILLFVISVIFAVSVFV